MRSLSVAVALVAVAASAPRGGARADEPSLARDLRFDVSLPWDAAASDGEPIPGTLFAGTQLRPTIDLVAGGATLRVGAFVARLLLGAGQAVDRLDAPSTSPWRHLLEASAGYTLPVGHGLTVEAGLFPSHIGFESFYTHDDWNATHAWMSLESPFFSAALRVRYPITERLSAMLLWMNGWSPVTVEHGFKSFGAQLVYARDHGSLALNLYAGPSAELATPGGPTWRLFADTVGQIQAAPRLQLAASFDAGADLGSDGRGPAAWYAIGVWARLQLTPWLALAIRSDVFDDRDGGAITGAPQLLAEATLTEEIALGPFLLRLDGRVDRASVPTPLLDGREDRELLILSFGGKL